MSHEVVAALIFHTGQILLGLRSAGREFYPNVWDMFGGHVEPGELPDQTLVRELMNARRSRDRASVDAAKRALGERGPVWWDDGAPDFNRHLAKNTPYAGWAERQKDS